MAISYHARQENAVVVYGLSTDTKPLSTECPNGGTFFEEDTAKTYRMESGSWVEKANTTYAGSASNIGTGGQGIFKQKVGGNFEFKKISAGSGLISVVDGGNDTVALDAVTSSIASSIKLDELAAPTDVTTLNATTSIHGLLPKLGGGSTNFLRADGTWNAPSTSAVWSSITGTLSSQTDLQSVLDMKQNSVLGITDTEIRYLDGVTSSVVSINNIQTLSNKTLVTPSIASFAQSQHDHQAGAGGGIFNASSVFSMSGGQIKTSILGTGTANSGVFLRGDSTWAAPTATVAITEAEIDVGATPVLEASIAVTDAGVSATSKIIGGVAYSAPTGKDLDELEMDALELKFEPAAGSLNVHIKGLEGYIADKFKIWYTFA